MARRGSRVGLTLHVGLRSGLYVRLVVEGLEPSIAHYTLAPEQARTPFTSRLGLTVAPNVVGVYPFRVTALDPAGTGYGVASLVLVILSHELPMEILGRLQAVLAYYRVYGIQYVIWYLLKHLYNDKGMSFTEVKAVYELLRKRRLSNGTVGDLLERMEKKGIIVKRGARYHAGIEDEKLVLEAIDVKRVKAGQRGAKQLLETSSEGHSTGRSLVGGEAMPLAVRRVLREVEKLIKQGRTGKALGFLQHTLIGVRRTGRWLLWVKDIFIYKERKAKPRFHYFRSEKLAKILQSMGLKQGFVHVEPAHDLIHNLFPGGYREARRIHYLVKNLGWLSYGKPLILYVAVYPDGTGGFKLENLSRETLVAVNYNPQKAIKTMRNLVIPSEHVDQNNDETYFRYR